MRRSVLIAGAMLVLGACGSTELGPEEYRGFTKPGAFLGVEIEDRIAALPLESGEQLMLNMTRIQYIGEPAIPYLIDGLTHLDPRMRGSCAYILGLLRDRRTIEPLKEALDDAHPSVRYEVATALCGLGDRGGYPVLIEGLGDSDIRNRYKAHEALQMLTRLDFGYRHDDGPGQREAAVRKWLAWWDRMRASGLGGQVAAR